MLPFVVLKTPSRSCYIWAGAIGGTRPEGNRGMLRCVVLKDCLSGAHIPVPVQLVVPGVKAIMVCCNVCGVCVWLLHTCACVSDGARREGNRGMLRYVVLRDCLVKACMLSKEAVRDINSSRPLMLACSSPLGGKSPQTLSTYNFISETVCNRLTGTDS